MKYLFSLLVSLSLSANEMDRIETIVADIETLRAEYTSCLISLKQNENNKYKKNLDEEIAKNNQLLSEINLLKNSINENNFEKQNKELKNILNTKDKVINNLKNKVSSLEKNKENTRNSLISVNKKSTVCTDENVFPQLIMKEKTQKEVKEETFTAATFRIAKNSKIYDSIDGSVVFEWEEKTSFTSNVMTENWMKITGYFIDKKWLKSKEELWIQKENIIKR